MSDIEKDNITDVVAHDFYGENCLASDINVKRKEKRGPEGYVEIHRIKTKDDGETETEFVGKHNLVVYLGREWLISRAANLNNPNIAPVYTDFISWFGIGNGGTLPGDPFDPDAPTNNDSELGNPIGISTNDTTCADLRGGYYYKHPFDEPISFEQDTENSNRYLIARVVTTIGPDDANGEFINEAALYVASSDAAGYTGPFHMYSRITFNTIKKTVEEQIIFTWFLYF